MVDCVFKSNFPFGITDDGEGPKLPDSIDPWLGSPIPNFRFWSPAGMLVDSATFRRYSLNRYLKSGYIIADFEGKGTWQVLTAEEWKRGELDTSVQDAAKRLLVYCDNIFISFDERHESHGILIRNAKSGKTLCNIYFSPDLEPLYQAVKGPVQQLLLFRGAFSGGTLAPIKKFDTYGSMETNVVQLDSSFTIVRTTAFCQAEIVPLAEVRSQLNPGFSAKGNDLYFALKRDLPSKR